MQQNELYDQVLFPAKSFFMDYPRGLAYSQFKLLLKQLEMLPDNEDQVRELYNDIDANEDGFVSYEEFSDHIMNNYGIQDEPRSFDPTEDEEMEPGLTIEKLTEIRKLFKNLVTKGEPVAISEVHKLIASRGISESDFESFFMDMMKDEKKELSETEFNGYAAKQEEKLLGLFCGSSHAIAHTDEFVMPAPEIEESSESQIGNLPGIDDASSSAYLGTENYTLDNYLEAMKEMVSEMTARLMEPDYMLVEQKQSLDNLNKYLDTAKKKLIALKNEVQTKSDSLANRICELEFLKKRNDEKEEYLYELQNNREIMEDQIKWLSNVESNYKKIKKEKEELDQQLIDQMHRINDLNKEQEELNKKIIFHKTRADNLSNHLLETKTDMGSKIEELKNKLSEVSCRVQPTEIVKIEQPAEAPKSSATEVEEEMADVPFSDEPEFIQALSNPAHQKQIFLLKKRIDTLQEKLNDLVAENNNLLDSNKRYLKELQEKDNKIVELGVIQKQLEQEGFELLMKLRHMGKSENLSENPTGYGRKSIAKTILEKKLAAANQDPFSQKKSEMPKLEDIQERESECGELPSASSQKKENTLFDQFGINEADMLRPSVALMKIESSTSTISNPENNRTFSVDDLNKNEKELQKEQEERKLKIAQRKQEIIEEKATELMKEKQAADEKMIIQKQVQAEKMETGENEVILPGVDEKKDIEERIIDIRLEEQKQNEIQEKSHIIDENKESKDSKIIDDKSNSFAVGEKTELPFNTIAAESVIPFEQKEMVDNPESIFHRDESSAKTEFDPHTRLADTEMEDPEQFQPRQSALLKQKDKMISKPIKQESEIAPAIIEHREEDHLAINSSDFSDIEQSQPFKQEEEIFISSTEKKDFQPSTFNPNTLQEKRKYVEEKKAIRPSTLSPETHIMFKNKIAEKTMKEKQKNELLKSIPEAKNRISKITSYDFLSIKTNPKPQNPKTPI